MIAGYYLGCPGWATKAWVGRLFPTATRPAEFLERYARVFNTVEGNTTFYALPSPDTVKRWDGDTPPEFRFCFKFPKSISHEKLRVDDDVKVFLDRIAPLGSKLGTLFLQLPPHFADLAKLAAFLDALPRGFHYGVELRHPALVVEDHEVYALLRERSIDLVTMDTRGLQRGHTLEFAEVRARKPRLPVIARTTANSPMIRCVPENTLDADIVEPWAAQIATWIGEGKTPYFFMHSPDDVLAPEHAYKFHALVRQHRDVGELPPWPGGVRQLSLL